MHDVLDVNAVGHQPRHSLLAEHVLAHAADEGDASAGPSRPDRLIGPFAAGGGEELAAENGFARPRDAVQLDDHVGVRTADDEDFGR